jgi:hypothetical protein
MRLPADSFEWVTLAFYLARTAPTDALVHEMEKVAERLVHIHGLTAIEADTARTLARASVTFDKFDWAKEKETYD